MLDGTFQLDTCFQTASWSLTVCRNYQLWPSFLIEVVLLVHGHQILSSIVNWVSLSFDCLHLPSIFCLPLISRPSSLLSVTTTLSVIWWRRDRILHEARKVMFTSQLMKSFNERCSQQMKSNKRGDGESDGRDEWENNCSPPEARIDDQLLGMVMITNKRKSGGRKT